MSFFKYGKLDPAFEDEDEFYNMTGFTVYQSGERLVHMQFWLAGRGVDARTHYHDEATAETTFCEIHACLVNGTGNGGMYRNVTDSSDDAEQQKLIVPSGAEHGPLWEIDEDGKPKKTPAGIVMYQGHKWKAGGSADDDATHSYYDFWMAFELNPDIMN